MRTKQRLCPECGRPYLPMSSALAATIVLFGVGLGSAALGGGAAWLLFDTGDAKWIGMLVGLIGGGALGMATINRKLTPGDGGEYCQCTDGA